MSLHRGTLADWTAADIANECGGAYAAYERRRHEHYTGYFANHPELKASHPLLARDLESALPRDWGELTALLPKAQRHRWVLSGKSSQALVLGLLGPAITLQPAGHWLTAMGTPAPGGVPSMRLEADLPETVLDERPRTTTVDFLVDAPDWVLCCEAKWTETGMGACSCLDSKQGTPTSSDCSAKVLERSRYWTTASGVFALPDRDPERPDQPCPLHPAYQAVRNVAAALALAGPDRKAHFSLIYDQENPYFSGHGWWPGWAEMLTRTLASAHAGLVFTAVSWQELVPQLPLDDLVRAWAAEKHELHTPTREEVPR